MTRDTMELAANCEAAEGADRALDGRIWAAVGGGVSLLPVLQGENILPISPDCPRFTASLDAAMTLVPGCAEYPEHKTFLLDCATQTSQFAQPVAYVWNDTGKHMGKGRTPALALCAAALKARAMGDG